MSNRKSYNQPTVPYYAHPDTPRIKPKYLRELPEWLVDRKILTSRKYQYLYKWIRDNWQLGDRFKILSNPDDDCSNRKISGRTGVFDGLHRSRKPMEIWFARTTSSTHAPYR